MPIEFTKTTAVLDVKGSRQELPNDFVWIFAGGIGPDDFLKQIGLHFGPRDLTPETVKEAREAAAGI
jgi:hypothetical protein